APVKERAAEVASSVPQMVAPVKDKITEMAAKAPVPGLHREAEEQPIGGFGPQGAHTQVPAEGAADLATSGIGAQNQSDVDIAGEENPLEDTPAQSVLPDVDGDGRTN